MENNIDIENLFRNSLENAEAQPPAGAWEAIQAQMGTTASAGAGTAATGLGLGKIAAIVATALGVGLGAGYLVYKGTTSGNQVQQNTHTPENNIQTAENTSSKEASNTAATHPKDFEITHISSAKKEGKNISIIEVKKDGETKTIRVEMPVKNQTPVNKLDKNRSIADRWKSQQKDIITEEQVIQRIYEEARKTENTNKNPDAMVVQKDNKQTTVKTVDDAHIEAAISANIDFENPLLVSFSNLTPANAYAWDFGDGSTSKQASPTHTYSEPGNYPVSLKVYDKSGKVYSTSSRIEVKPLETDSDTKSAMNAPHFNVITPNNDGMNDNVHFESQNIESFSFMVFDAQGKVVFSSNDPNMTWNGTDMGANELPVGLYHYEYRAKGKDGEIYQDGNVFTISRR